MNDDFIIDILVLVVVIPMYMTIYRANITDIRRSSIFHRHKLKERIYIYIYIYMDVQENMIYY